MLDFPLRQLVDLCLEILHVVRELLLSLCDLAAASFDRLEFGFRLTVSRRNPRGALEEAPIIRGMRGCRRYAL